MSLADETPTDKRLSWRLSPEASVAFAQRFRARARRGTFWLRILLLLSSAAIFGYLRLQHASPAVALKLDAWVVIPAFVIIELVLFVALRRPARRLAEVASGGIDVAVLLPSGVRIGPLQLICGDQTGFPRPTLLVDEKTFPPVLTVTGTYQSVGPTRNGSYHLEVPIAPEAVTGVKAWIVERNAKHLAAMLGKRS